MVVVLGRASTGSFMSFFFLLDFKRHCSGV